MFEDDPAMARRVIAVMWESAADRRLVQRVVMNGLMAAWTNPRYRGPMRRMLARSEEIVEALRAVDAAEEGLRGGG